MDKLFLKLRDDIHVRVAAITHIEFTKGKPETPQKERVHLYFEAQTGASEGGKGGGQRQINSDDPVIVGRVKAFLAQNSIVF